ncbi:MAG: type III secretion system stator protein SctL [Puniceicoccales bacterium]|jgi:type III secretion protein L|nr:type III secretion system stator protein SctL [Puniceicoccales bacterium]
MACDGIYQIQTESLDLQRSGRVLKAESYATMLHASILLTSIKAKCEKLLQKAEAEAAKIIASAKEQSDEIIGKAQQAKKDEEKRGYDVGVNAGKQKIANEMMDFVTKSANSFSKLEKDVAAVVSTAVRKILGKIEKNELIVSVVKNSLQKIKMQKQAKLKVAPAEAQLLRDRIMEIAEGNAVLQFLEVAADARLQPGSCVIETELGVIDASVSVQLESIENALSKVRS